MYFPSSVNFCTPIQLFTAEGAQSDSPFSGNDFRDDWRVLNDLLREKGYELPWPLNRALNGFLQADRRFLHSQR